MNKKIKDELELEEELHWLKLYLKQVEGLGALAEANADGLDTNWLAMQYGLEALANLIHENIKYREEMMK